MIGQPGGGWRVAMSTAGNERGLTLRSPAASSPSRTGWRPCWRSRADPSDTALRDRVADAVIGARAYQLFTYANASRFLDGAAVGPEASLKPRRLRSKPIATTTPPSPPRWTAQPRTRTPPRGTPAGPIYAGTNEIQRDIIAERLLGLPKGRRDGVSHLHTGVADSLDAMLTAADTPSVVRDWSRGDHGGGRALWSRIARLACSRSRCRKAYEGMGPHPVELAVGFVESGRAAVPGPWW